MGIVTGVTLAAYNAQAQLPRTALHVHRITIYQTVCAIRISALVRHIWQYNRKGYVRDVSMDVLSVIPHNSAVSVLQASTFIKDGVTSNVLETFPPK
jgi:hypothetical protein